MRLYLDCCCYNRPFDDSVDNNVSDEGNAVYTIIKRALTNDDIIIGSPMLDKEIDNIKDSQKHFDVKMLYNAASVFVDYDDMIILRSAEIRQNTAIHLADSIHLASAEFGKADIFLTTDLRLIRSCKQLNLKFRVLNPLEYLDEVNKNGRI